MPGTHSDMCIIRVRRTHLVEDALDEITRQVSTHTHTHTHTARLAAMPIPHHTLAFAFTSSAVPHTAEAHFAHARACVCV